RRPSMATPSATVTRIPLSSTRVRSDVSTVWILPSVSAAQAPTTENIIRIVTTAHNHFAITCSSLRRVSTPQSRVYRCPHPPSTKPHALFGGLLQAQSRSRRIRSEEHTSELQSRGHLVCRL